MEQAFDDLDAPIARVCAANVPMPYSPPLEEAVIPGTDDIIAAARTLVHGKNTRGARSSGGARAAPKC